MHCTSIVELISGLNEWDKVVVDMGIIGVAPGINPVVTHGLENLTRLRHCLTKVAKVLPVAINEPIPMLSQKHKEMVRDV